MFSLPFIAFILFFLFFLQITFFRKRLAFLWASIIWTLTAVFIVEALSLFHALTCEMVAGSWALVNLAALAGVLFYPREKKIEKPVWFEKVPALEVFWIFMTAGIICLVGINGFWAAPNNWDSMTYHLPRVMHWIENRSVEHYPTPILRQLYQPPGSEFLMLHFQILAQNDRFANGVQWFSLLGAVLMGTLVAAELGVQKTGQVLCGVLTATIPMAILQGSSTQNDLVVGFWLVCFFYFSLRLVKGFEKTQGRWVDLWGASLTLAFALLTKGSAYVFAAPWLVVLVLWGFLKKRPVFLRDIFVIVLVCLAVNSGFYGRNIGLFGAPFSAGKEDYFNKGNIMANCIINVARNVSLHLGTPSVAVNTFIKEKILGAQSFLGKAENNSWSDFDVLSPTNSEDVAGNPFHLALIGMAFFAVFFRRPQQAVLLAYILVIIAGFFIFCAFFRWQLFHSRLHLPLFLVSMPVVALVLEKMRFRWGVIIVAGILLAGSLGPVFYNERRPIVGKKNIFNTARIEQYFFYRKFMALPYILASQYALGPGNLRVGLLLGEDDWEYPLWVLLKNQRKDLRIYHVSVDNVSKSLLSRDAIDVEVIISQKENLPNLLSVNQALYLKRRRVYFMSVYAKIPRH